VDRLSGPVGFFADIGGILGGLAVIVTFVVWGVRSYRAWQVRVRNDRDGMLRWQLLVRRAPKTLNRSGRKHRRRLLFARWATRNGVRLSWLLPGGWRRYRVMEAAELEKRQCAVEVDHEPHQWMTATEDFWCVGRPRQEHVRPH